MATKKDDFDLLWELAGAKRRGFKEPLNNAFWNAGLILERDVKRTKYGGSPLNTVTFGGTGGDSVHFGFLLINNFSWGNCPVVMSVPCMDYTNIVLGENLREFLAFGCRTGYFCLEELAYEPKSMIRWLESHEYAPDIEEEELTQLKKIEHAFGLKPPTKVSKRLKDLKAKFEPLFEKSSDHEL